MDVIKHMSKYLNTSVGNVCLNTDKVLTAAFDREIIEGFASIILRLSSKSSKPMNKEEVLLSYQWLEHFSMYLNQALANPVFAKNFLQGINRGLEKNSYLTGSKFNVTDVAAYYILYPIIERLTIVEQESLIHLCRWAKNIQAQPNACGSRKPLQFNTLTLSVLAPAVH